ncbi:dihydrodipicolinate synthase family protein [Irregularibacter muris]|uniref:Dihydrodipicolinate synthase family protein n=1 Tax=Irregularibacter muris TaxID=1796619 RepID=A0AAE3L2N8_9FIRM|nr:dihydrodipicolinate synthase family protein [Irregularibacter muris]MCR1898904.1 dihydrodipicolinate synthase family protein [Irregularibacter muris]
MRAKWLTPVITAFDKEGNIDHQANKNMYDHLIKNNSDGIVVMGSIGEFFAMNLEQKKELAQLAIEHIHNRTKVIVGTGGMLVKETIELSNYVYDLGADAVMVISPYYFKLAEKDIQLFYDEVAKNTKAKIYMYNFPAITGYNITPEITLNLLNKHSNIIGYKDTVTEMNHTRELINKITKDFPEFEIYSSYDENFAHNVLSGGAGAIGGLSNIIPEICAKWVEAINKKEFHEVEKMQKFINKMMAIYDIANPFVSTLKKAVMLRGVEIKDYCILPLAQVNQEQSSKIKSLMEELEILC